MKPLNWLKKYFIPHPGNDHKPHFLREKAVITVAIVAALVFAGSFVQRLMIERGVDNKFIAAVISSVLVDLTNQNRLAANTEAPVLTPSALLTEAAQQKANDMVANGYFAHKSPDGKDPWYWLQAVGYKFSSAGENLAVNFSDSEEVINAWMNSPGHRANIVNGKYTEVGIATAEGVYDGRPAVFVVQMFGRPKTSQTSVTSTSSSSTPVVVTSVSTTLVTLTSATPTKSAVEGAATNTVLAESKPRPRNVIKPVAVATSSLSSTSKSELALFSTTTVVANINDEASVFSNISGSALAVQRSNIFEKLIASPKKALNTVYGILASLVTIALVLMIFIKVRIQHPRNIVYGVILVLLMVGFVYVGSSLVGNSVAVAMGGM